MSGNWEPGDLAVCIQAGLIWRNGFALWGKGLVRGHFYIVERVRIAHEVQSIVLHLKGDSELGANGRLAARFQKVRPYSADDEDEETVRLLSRAPVPEPVL